MKMRINTQTNVTMECMRPFTSSQRVRNWLISRSTRTIRARRRIRSNIMFSRTEVKASGIANVCTMRSMMPQHTRNKSNFTQLVLKTFKPKAAMRATISKTYTSRNKRSKILSSSGISFPSFVIADSAPIVPAFTMMTTPISRSNPRHNTIFCIFPLKVFGSANPFLSCPTMSASSGSASSIAISSLLAVVCASLSFAFLCASSSSRTASRPLPCSSCSSPDSRGLPSAGGKAGVGLLFGDLGR
mmetsp:Transcript_10256/g.27370  ORF Transcript_10256/g.27370 Transcript_10256/m.27370 type:complete len:244 (-) Transcript_10256:136-867(-)